MLIKTRVCFKRQPKKKQLLSFTQSRWKGIFCNWYMSPISFFLNHFDILMFWMCVGWCYGILAQKNMRKLLVGTSTIRWNVCVFVRVGEGLPKMDVCNVLSIQFSLYSKKVDVWWMFFYWQDGYEVYLVYRLSSYLNRTHS